MFLELAKVQQILREAFHDRGAELITTYRYGPYKIVALFRIGDNAYWNVMSQTSADQAWTQTTLDIYLHEDLIRQLDLWRSGRGAEFLVEAATES